jgi:GR25 family glycosyltransferase involved in LPS biosynthesis
MAGMARLEISSARRFEGVVDPIGAVGCGRSHCALLREMIEKSWPAMMICEDDARFLVDRPRLDLLIDTFLDDPDAEVACLAFRSRKVSRHNRLFLRGMTVRTTACYILKLSIAADLLALWEDALARLTETGDGQNAVDLVWDTLQDERRFLVPIRRVVYQEAGYSDISRKFVDHSSSDGWRFREAQ